ncbi:Shell matrix protein [Balamuthia mandrillaris]
MTKFVSAVVVCVVALLLAVSNVHGACNQATTKADCRAESSLAECCLWCGVSDVDGVCSPLLCDDTSLTEDQELFEGSCPAQVCIDSLQETGGVWGCHCQNTLCFRNRNAQFELVGLASDFISQEKESVFIDIVAGQVDERLEIGILVGAQVLEENEEGGPTFIVTFTVGAANNRNATLAEEAANQLVESGGDPESELSQAFSDEGFAIVGARSPAAGEGSDGTKDVVNGDDGADGGDGGDGGDGADGSGSDDGDGDGGGSGTVGVGGGEGFVMTSLRLVL